MRPVKLTECPRDAMQGLHNFIPTEVKAAYINAILKCGFDTVDFGSFVSHRAIPQMQDTAAVLDKLDMGSTSSKLLVITANYRGAEEAVKYGQIAYVGFPFSISSTFQQRNTHSTIEQSFGLVKDMAELCDKNDKQLRIYLSMAFGNPYGDEWSTELLLHWVDAMLTAGINNIYLADTIGMATAEQLKEIFEHLPKSNCEMQFGVHLHSTADTWYDKVDAAWQSGCRLFDTAIKGYGGCPMALDKLTGNIATENLLGYLEERRIETGINAHAFTDTLLYAAKVFA